MFLKISDVIIVTQLYEHFACYVVKKDFRYPPD